MNKSENADFKEIKRTVDNNTLILKRIDKCLNGDPDDRNDAGLVGDVRNNKRWKNMVNKILGGTGTISLGLLIKEIFRAIKPGG